MDSLRAALDPDAVELAFRFHPDGRRYRRRFVGARSGAARAVREGTSPAASETALVVPFAVEGLASGSLSLVRRRSRPWTGAERMRFDLLRPLAAQALECAARNEADRKARGRLAWALDLSEAPVLLLDASGTILFASEAADALLSRQTEEGLAVLSRGRGTTPLLTHLIRLATTAPGAVRERLALTNGRSIEARLSTVAEEPAEGEAAVRVVTLHEPDPISIEDVRPHLAARGVSGREADVVAGVLQGWKNAEIAAALFICEYTVKDHLKHVYAKLGVSSRGGLIRALYAAPGGAA